MRTAMPASLASPAPGGMARRARTLALIAAGVGLWSAGCATSPTGPGGGPEFRGVPGFDTRVFPGETAMRRWRTTSPYRWVGYYLLAPCHTDSTWMGQRALLQQIGWGTAALFVGEQDWAAAGVTAQSLGVEATSTRCTSGNLSAEHGAADAQAADSLMAAQGFAPGARLFLDVEPVDSVSTRLATYIQAWIGGLLDRGRYLPALYGSYRNADSLRAIQVAEYTRRNRPRPQFWVAGSSGFDIHAAPTESGFPYAAVWQGFQDVSDSWGGTTLSIDVDVADSPAPSTASLTGS